MFRILVIVGALLKYALYAIAGLGLATGIAMTLFGLGKAQTFAFGPYSFNGVESGVIVLLTCTLVLLALLSVPPAVVPPKSPTSHNFRSWVVDRYPAAPCR